MMDIVEWLRDDTKYCQCSFMDIYKPLEMEAADEIERLREENKMMQYYLPENINFVRCSEGKDHFSFEIVYKELGEEE